MVKSLYGRRKLKVKIEANHREKATVNESIEITFTVHKNLNAKILIAFL